MSQIIPRPVIVAGLLGGAVLGLYFVTLAPGITWQNDGADGGDLTTAVAVMGVAHPGGYPTYLLLARFFQLLPIGSLAYRTTLLSAVSAAVGAILTAQIVAISYQGRRRFGWAGSVLAGFGFGLSPLLWSQAVITEVYGLHTLLISALTLTALNLTLSTNRSLWLTRLGSLLIGLALGNHLTTILFLPVWLGVASWNKSRLRLDWLIECAVWILLGLLVYVYVPLRASAHPPVNWGGASTFEGFWWLVSGQNYRSLVFGLPSDLLLTRLQAWAGLVMAQFSWPGLMVALYGLFFGSTRRPAVRLITLWLVVVFSVFAIGYGTSDSSAYLLPAFLGIAVWFGLGAATGLESLTGRWQGLRLPVLGGVLICLFANALHYFPEVDASRDLSAESFGKMIMAQAPAEAIIVTTNDQDTFALWYYHYALQQRPDLTVIVEPLLQFQWYGDNLRYTYPGLAFPLEQPFSVEGIFDENPRPVCYTTLEPEPSMACNLAP